jgi:hypothetical protein
VESGIFLEASQWLALDDPNMLQDNLPEWSLINEVQERFLEAIVFRTLGDLDRLISWIGSGAKKEDGKSQSYIQRCWKQDV